MQYLKKLKSSREIFISKNVDFLKFYRENNLYFDVETEMLISQYFDAADKNFRDFAEYQSIIENGEEPSEQQKLITITAYEKLSETIQPIKLKLKYNFRKLLGE